MERKALGKLPACLKDGRSPCCQPPACLKCICTWPVWISPSCGPSPRLRLAVNCVDAREMLKKCCFVMDVIVVITCIVWNHLLQWVNIDISTLVACWCLRAPTLYRHIKCNNHLFLGRTWYGTVWSQLKDIYLRFLWNWKEHFSSILNNVRCVVIWEICKYMQEGEE